MDALRLPRLHTRSRHSCQWDKKFCARRNASHKAEDIHILDNADPKIPNSRGPQEASTETLIQKFFKVQPSILDPPCFNFRALKTFLGMADFKEAKATSQSAPISRRKVALVDDRRDRMGGEELVRNWDSETYSRRPPEGHEIFVEALDEVELYAHLLQKVSSLQLQDFVGFSMEFHLPYLALREGPPHGDPRRLRKWFQMLRMQDTNVADIFYEAQISVLLVGVDEWFWTENSVDGSAKIETFFDDEHFSGTKKYTWAVSLLRRFHDLLLKTIESWDLFVSTELDFFDVDSEVLRDLWGNYFSRITNDVSELRFMQRSLEQRIQTFDRMKDGVRPHGFIKYFLD
ncbi:MAG: hypothetical protein Q9160_000314 [Pyrenula sp. 1 TL-2023]